MGPSLLGLFLILPRPAAAVSLSASAPATPHGALVLALDAAIGQAAGSPGLGEWTRLRDSLTLDALDGLRNQSALEPLLSALREERPDSLADFAPPTTPAQALRLLETLGPALTRARDQANADVDSMHDEFVAKRLMNPLRPSHELYLNMNFDRALILVSHQRAYLDDRRAAMLDAMWPGIQSAHAAMRLRLKREGRKLGEATKKAAEELGFSIQDVSGLATDERAERDLAYAGPPEGHDNAQLGLEPSEPTPQQQADQRERTADALRQQFLAGEEPTDDEGHAYPLNAVKASYLGKIREFAESGDFYRFGQWARTAWEGPLHGFAGRLSEDVLKPVLAVGRLGPRSRDLLDSARRQSETLFQLIGRLRPVAPPEYKLYLDLAQEKHGEIEGLIWKAERKLQRKEDKARARANRAREGLQRYQGESDGRMTAHLFSALDYFHWLLGAARRDAPDRRHFWEAQKLVRDGEGDPGSPIHILGLASVREIWVMARANGAGKTLTLKALLALGAALLLNLGWVLALPHTPLTIIPVAVAAGGLMTVYYLARGGERLGAVVTALIALAVPAIMPGGPLLGALGLSVGLATLWLLRAVGRAQRFRRLGREIRALWQEAQI